MKNRFEPPDDRDVLVLDLEIRPEDIDANGHVNNVIYVRWLQDAGTAHWLARASKEEIERWTWVALRHEIDYRLPLKLGDRARARTWVGEARGPRFDRFVLIERADGKVCAQGRTDWALVDPKTMKAARITDAMVQPFLRL
jgi:acyl-CoA thioester hydrolase